MAKKDTSKKAASKAAKPAKQKKPSRIKQIGESYRLTKKTDPRIGLILLGSSSAAGVLRGRHRLPGGGHPRLLDHPRRDGGPPGRADHLRPSCTELRDLPDRGQARRRGVRARLLRRGWKVEPGIAFNRQQDVAHRLVGPPGIVLIGEGNPNRLRPLLTSERRKHERVVSEATITEIVVGDDEGQVPLRRLTKHVTKLPKTLKPAEMTDVLARLKALDATRSNIPLPKGPIPTSMKGSRQNMRGR